ncbi:hypothetical protein [Gillisia sp. Hel_I_86]|uniref:hypothetical protein n=1 Tax=Gillisia sp. Hel_I_86 TaxID=1249981 RepID=UPI00119E0F50|nr:hypothetical protein [Gillisia sp. Hel_I_86]
MFVRKLNSKNSKTYIQAVKDKIGALDLNHGKSTVIKKGDLKLIVAYSERAKKDRYNREKGLRRLEKISVEGSQPNPISIIEAITNS